MTFSKIDPKVLHLGNTYTSSVSKDNEELHRINESIAANSSNPQTIVYASENPLSQIPFQQLSINQTNTVAGIQNMLTGTSYHGYSF